MPQFIIKRSCSNFVITFAPIGNKKFPNLWYSFTPICNKLMLKLIFFAISRVLWRTTTKLDVTMLLMMKFIKTRSCNKVLRLHFHFVKPYNRQAKRNGTFRNLVLGSCLLRKGAGTLHQIYIFVGEGVNKWGYVTFILDHLIWGFLNSWQE